MPLFVTKKAMIACGHETGVVILGAEQTYVTIEGTPILIKPDPAGKTIVGCSNANPPVGIKPCTRTQRVLSGTSAFINIDGIAVCLEPVTGLTDGTPPGAVPYNVKTPGQDFVNGSA